VNRALDISPYINTHLQPSSSSASANALYDLYGVVNHSGGLLGGHYTAYARTPHASARDKNELGMSVSSARDLLHKLLRMKQYNN